MPSTKTRIEVRKFKDINTWMLAGKPKNAPEVLQGVFFMDGNPATEDCLTFHGGRWDPEARRLKLPSYAALQWTFTHSDAGRRFLRRNRFLRVTIEIRFLDESLEHADIVLTYLGIPMPRWIAKYTLDRAEGDTTGDTWQRRNLFFFKRFSLGDYTLRRIADGNGEKIPAFEDMLGKVLDTCLVVADADSDS